MWIDHQLCGRQRIAGVELGGCGGGYSVFRRCARTLVGYLPALLPVAAAFFVTNYAAHDRWIPAYAHRDVGS